MQISIQNYRNKLKRKTTEQNNYENRNHLRFCAHVKCQLLLNQYFKGSCTKCILGRHANEHEFKTPFIKFSMNITCHYINLTQDSDFFSKNS